MISLSESWAAGLVPIVSDLGAPAERVTDGIDGFVVSRGDMGRIAELLRMLSHDRERLRKMREKIKQKPIMHSHGHAALLARQYDRLMLPLAKRESGLKKAERLTFNRLLYAARFTNNKWTDTATLWDATINHSHLGQGWDVERLPQFPLADLPLRYHHLPRETRDNRVLQSVKIVEDQAIWVDLRQERSVSFRIFLLPQRQLVEVYLRLSFNQGSVVVPVVIGAGQANDVCIGRAQFSQHVRLEGASLLCVYDGQVIEHTHVSDEGVSGGLLDKAVHGEGLKPEIVEGCDQIRKLLVKEGSLCVEGWAFDPVSAEVPPECCILISDETGATVRSPARRVLDPAIIDVEPIYAYSGFAWSCPLEELAAALPLRGSKLTLWVVQTLQGRALTSNVAFDIPVHKLVAENGPIQVGAPAIDKERLPALASALGSVSPDAAEQTILDQMKLLVKLIDTRVLVSRPGGQPLGDEERRRLLSNYILQGEAAGQSPLIEFEPSVYRMRNPEIAGRRPLLVHYWAFGRREGRVASERHKAMISQEAVTVRPHMDEVFYKAQAFGDTPFSGDLAQHYVSFGELNGLRPTPQFDPAYYRRSNRDLQKRNLCLFSHYISFGKQEGRRGSENARLESRHAAKRALVLDIFDAAYYVEQAPYLRNTDIDPICHFFEYGARNGLSPSRDFAKESGKPGAAPLEERFLAWSKEAMARLPAGP